MLRKGALLLVLGFLGVPVSSGAQVWEKLLAPGLTYRAEVDSTVPRMIHALRWSPRSRIVQAVPELAAGTIYEANAGKGTRDQRDSAEVKHSTKKQWRQKGTGRARAGMTSSPLWRGGGRIFPNSPDENFTQKVNKKMYRAGMAAIFSQLAREGRLAVIDSMEVDSPKTKLFAAKLKAMGLDSVLVIADQVDDNLLLASRNLRNVLVVEPRHADPLSLVHYKKVLVTKAAIEQLKEMLA